MIHTVAFNKLNTNTDNVVTASVPCDCKSLSHKFDHPSHRRHLKDVGKAHLVLFHHGLQTAKSTKG